jgi:hypothetical protein
MLPFFPVASSSPLTRFSDKNSSKMEKTSIGYENWQIIYRWKALDEENTLGQFIFGLVHYKSLASKGKRFECKIQLDGLENNQINWQFRERRVGPTILLKRLLAQISSLLYDFHHGVGVQNRRQ